jgi:transposase-like protein
VIRQDACNTTKGSFDMYDETQSPSSAICEAVVASVPLVSSARSSGALTHFFLLLNYVKWSDQDAVVNKVNTHFIEASLCSST